MHTQAILFLNQFRKETDPRKNDSEFEFQFILSRSKNSEFDFRVVECRIRLFPTLISKINWLESEVPLNELPIKFLFFDCVNLSKPVSRAIFSNKFRDLNPCFQNVQVEPLSVIGLYFAPHPESMWNVFKFTFDHCYKNVWSSMICLFAVWPAYIKLLWPF